MKTSWRGNLFLAIFSVVGALALCEGVLRYGVEPIIYWGERAPTALCQGMRPRYRFIDEAVAQNGNIMPEVLVPALETGERRVLVLGDSQTYGLVPYEERFPTLLENLLQQRMSQEGLGKVSAINAGLLGTNTVDQACFLESGDLDFGQDTVVLGLYVGNDITENDEDDVWVMFEGSYYKRRAIIHSDWKIVFWNFLDHSQLVRRLRLAWRGYGPTGLDSAGPFLHQQIDKYFRLLEQKVLSWEDVQADLVGWLDVMGADVTLRNEFHGIVEATGPSRAPEAHLRLKDFFGREARRDAVFRKENPEQVHGPGDNPFFLWMVSSGNVRLCATPEDYEAQWDVTFRKLLELKETTRHREERFVVVILPDRYQLDGPLRRLMRLDFFINGKERDFDVNYPQRRLSEFMSEAEIAYVDMQPVFQDAENPVDLFLSGDNHFNRAGNELIAKALAERILLLEVEGEGNEKIREQEPN